MTARKAGRWAEISTCGRRQTARRAACTDPRAGKTGGPEPVRAWERRAILPLRRS